MGKSTKCQKIAFDWFKGIDHVQNNNTSFGSPGKVMGSPLGREMNSVDGVDEVDSCVIPDPKHSDNGKTNENKFNATMQNGNSSVTLPYLKQFSLVFLIHARGIRDSIFDCVYKNLLPEEFSVSKKDFHDYVVEHQKETLFLIDGYDEMLNLNNETLSKLVQKQSMEDCTVLLTSRPQYVTSLRKSFDSEFLIKGYNRQHMVEFITKYAENLSPETLVDLIKIIDNDSSINDLCRNPLNLIFMCELCQEKQGELPNTRTKIYEEK